MADQDTQALQSSISENAQAVERLSSMLSQLMDSMNLLAANISGMSKGAMMAAGGGGGGGGGGIMPMAFQGGGAEMLSPADAEFGDSYQPTGQDIEQEDTEGGGLTGFLSKIPLVGGLAAAGAGLVGLGAERRFGSESEAQPGEAQPGEAELAQPATPTDEGGTSEKQPWWKTFTNVSLGDRLKAGWSKAKDEAITGAMMGGGGALLATAGSGGLAAPSIPIATATGGIGGGLYGFASGFLTGSENPEEQAINAALGIDEGGQASSEPTANPQAAPTMASIAGAEAEAQGDPNWYPGKGKALGAYEEKKQLQKHENWLKEHPPSASPSMIKPPSGQDTSRIATSPQVRADEVMNKSAQVKDNDKVQQSSQPSSVTNNSPTTINNTTVTTAKSYGRNYDPDVQNYYAGKYDLW